MDKKTTIFGYLSEVFKFYGITIVLLNMFVFLFGEDAQTVSPIFTFGNKGLDILTMMEFLAVIALNIALRMIFMTDMVIKKMPLAARIILMFTGVLAVTVGFIFAFGWFPTAEILSWVLFVICFVLSCGISTLIAILAEKQENKLLEDALKRLKEAQ